MYPIAPLSFQAENPDELNMVDQVVNNRMINIINLTKCLQEELELLGEGDDEGWVRARNYKGEVTGILKL